ncbi:fructokinase [Prosthecobacter debontii]|uniref:fructokinase n=1 Tax=Prosthecobacter debontii TaxID=48467 RepID=A0A1T4XGU4_9BACT|nr:ROK family protein [Prosthecobacter debontii]SKA88713.1 fructokinase [Prosthecobacter debontii]
MSEQSPLIVAIEGGGTKFVCGIGSDPHHLLATTRIETTTPQETLENVSHWISKMKVEHGPIAAIGIGTFGPVDLNKESDTYGYITTTPKPHWHQTDVVGFFRNRFKVPVGFDTDVNAAVLAEYLWGAGQGKDPLIYITVGTGVGGGVLVNGQLLHGLLHPEIGHLIVPPPHNSLAIQREGQCPYHKSCVEGYVCGPSIAKRWGVKADALPPDHPAWEEVADVMGYALMNLTLTLSPKRIILGGGVMQQPHLIPLVQGKLMHHLNGYVAAPELSEDIQKFLTSPGLGGRSGLLGSLALGRMALGEKNVPTS